MRTSRVFMIIVFLCIYLIGCTYSANNVHPQDTVQGRDKNVITAEPTVLIGDTRVEKPLFPKPSIYPDAVNISTEILDAGRTRLTKFQTSATSAQVLIYYRTTLLKEGWQVDIELENKAKYIYMNNYIPKNDNKEGPPMFSLELNVRNTAPNKVDVALRQSISGPFSWETP